MGVTTGASTLVWSQSMGGQRASCQAAWRRLGQSYWEAWRELHPVCGILRNPRSGQLILIRDGHIASQLRPACPAEYLLRGIAPPAATFGPELLKLQACLLLHHCHDGDPCSD